jgi:hypothetical protein
VRIETLNHAAHRAHLDITAILRPRGTIQLNRRKQRKQRGKADQNLNRCARQDSPSGEGHFGVQNQIKNYEHLFSFCGMSQGKAVGCTALQTLSGGNKRQSIQWVAPAFGVRRFPALLNQIKQCSQLGESQYMQKVSFQLNRSGPERVNVSNAG